MPDLPLVFTRIDDLVRRFHAHPGDYREPLDDLSELRLIINRSFIEHGEAHVQKHWLPVIEALHECQDLVVKSDQGLKVDIGDEMAAGLKVRFAAEFADEAEAKAHEARIASGTPIAMLAGPTSQQMALEMGT